MIDDGRIIEYVIIIISTQNRFNGIPGKKTKEKIII